MSFYFYKEAVEKEKKKDNTARNIALGAGALALAAGGTAYAVSPEFRSAVNEAAGKAKDSASKAYAQAKPKVESAARQAKQRASEAKTYLFEDRARIKGIEANKMVTRTVPMNPTYRVNVGGSVIQRTPQGLMRRYSVEGLPSRFESFVGQVRSGLSKGFGKARDAGEAVTDKAKKRFGAASANREAESVRRRFSGTSFNAL